MPTRGRGGTHDRRYAELREYKAGHLAWDRLEALGAHGVGIGRKWSEGKPTNTLSLRFYVARKRPVGQLAATEKVPSRLRFTSRRGLREVELITDVIEAAPAQFEEIDPETALRPVPGGVSVGAGGSSGTLGGWVWDRTDGSIVMLSNEHVFGSVPGVDIVQPSLVDGGQPSRDRIGVVKRGFARSDTEPNRVDCAVGAPLDRALIDPSVIEIGPAVEAVMSATEGLGVEKFGQSSRHTFGEVVDLDWLGMVSGRRFEECLLIDPAAPTEDWSGPGDSGSLVFAREPIEPGSPVRPVVGLHFAGMGLQGLASKVENVFAALDLGVLSAEALASLVDGLAGGQGAVEPVPEAELALAGPAGPAAAFWPRTIGAAGLPAGLYRGFAGDLAARLAASQRGRRINRFVQSHRREILALLLAEGDLRRATIAALGPLLAGAVTTGDVLERSLTEQDWRALDRLFAELDRKGSPALRTAVRTVRALRPRAAGKSLGEILRIEQ